MSNPKQKEIKASRIFAQIARAQTRIIVNEGSSRSTKTISILQYLIIECLRTPGTTVTAARAKLTWAKTTIMPDFREVMEQHFGIWEEDRWSKSESAYTFVNGSVFSFVGLDEAQKLHGRKQDFAWVNEAVEIEQAEFRQLLIRTVKQVILDYNPAYETHWIYDTVIPRDDCTLIRSTYKDNAFLSPDVRTEIERLEPTPVNIMQGTADEVSWKIYGLGERAAHKGLIFAKAQICKELPPKEDRKKHFFGLDFGFTNDPSCLAEIALAHGALYLRQRVYKRGLTNIINPAYPTQQSLQGHFVQEAIPKSAKIWADAAEPKSIQDLRNVGYNVTAAVKGPDSILAGIETILRYPLYITEDSLDAIKERNNYKWKETKGVVQNEPIDNWNHFWDAVRYGCIMELKRGDVHLPISGHGSGVIHSR